MLVLTGSRRVTYDGIDGGKRPTRLDEWIDWRRKNELGPQHLIDIIHSWFFGISNCPSSGDSCPESCHNAPMSGKEFIFRRSRQAAASYCY